MRRLAVLLAFLAPTLLLPAVTAEAATAYVVTIQASKTTIVLGEKAVFTGTVTPKAAGKTVTLQMRYSTTASWSALRTATVQTDGTYRVGDTPSSLRARYYRVLKPASATLAAGASPSVRVRVFRWRYLADLPVHATDSNIGTVVMNGHSYAKSVYGDPSGTTDLEYSEYNLSRKCIKLRATYGISDDSDTGGQGGIEVSGDGNILHSDIYGLGETTARDLAIGNVLRIRFDMRDAFQDGARVFPTVGSPRVLCSF